MYGVLIEHPQAGLILYEVGGPPNYEELWPRGVLDVFPVTTYSDEHRLDHRLHQLGYDLDQISAIVIGHLHLDHAGGLEFFRGRDVPIYVHEAELAHAFHAVATGEDLGGEISGQQFNCMQCHVQQVEIPAPVKNLFEGNFRDEKSKYSSDLADKPSNNNIPGFKSKKVDELLAKYDVEFDRSN